MNLLLRIVIEPQAKSQESSDVDSPLAESLSKEREELLHVYPLYIYETKLMVGWLANLAPS